MLLGALVAARSIRVRDALGLGPTLLSAAGLQLIVIAAMGLVLHPLIVLLALARSCPRALMTAPINAAVAPRVPQQQRATYLSLVSLGGRLAFGGALVLLSLLTFGRQTDWQRISFLLCVSAAAGLVPLALLVLSVRALNVGKRERGNV
jgi:hypothetical protein